MSIDPGTALAVTSLTFQAFAGCIKGFVLISTAHNLGKDASLLLTMLNLEEYHFTQWADKVGLTKPHSKLDPRLNQALAADLMGQLEVLLGSNKLKERYKLELVVDNAKSTPVDNVDGNTGDSPNGILTTAVSNETRGKILERAKLIQSKNHLPKRLWWAAVDKGRFENLVRDVRTIVQGLWALLDPFQQSEMMSHIQQMLSTVVEISNDVRGLKGLQQALGDYKHVKNSVPLATVAGLKAVRVELQDDISQLSDEGISFSSTQQVVTRSRRDILTAPLSRTLLTDVVSHTGDSSRAGGFYSGSPVLIEYKAILPRLKSKLKPRVENLAALLSTNDEPSFLTLHCLGFLEESDRFIFIFAYPGARAKSEVIGQQALEEAPDSSISHQPTSIAQHPISRVISLLDLLRNPAMQPSVTARISLGLNICQTLLALHTAGWLHKDIRAANILFFPPSLLTNSGSLSSMTSLSFLSKPYLSGFQFSRFDSPTEISEQPSSSPTCDIYRHPSALGEPATSYSKAMDLYSLGCVMVEIAEWRALKTIVRKHVDVTKEGVEVPLNQIAELGPWLEKEKLDTGTIGFRMGERFHKAVASFLGFGDIIVAEEVEQNAVTESEMLRFHVNQMEKCII